MMMPAILASVFHTYSYYVLMFFSTAQSLSNYDTTYFRYSNISINHDRSRCSL